MCFITTYNIDIFLFFVGQFRFDPFSKTSVKTIQNLKNHKSFIASKRFTCSSRIHLAVGPGLVFTGHPILGIPLWTWLNPFENLGKWRFPFKGNKQNVVTMAHIDWFVLGCQQLVLMAMCISAAHFSPAQLPRSSLVCKLALAFSGNGGSGKPLINIIRENTQLSKACFPHMW